MLVKEVIAQHLEKSCSQIGELVKKKRISKGWNILDLAFYSRLSEKTIYNVESRKDVNMSLRTLISLSVALEIDVSVLVESQSVYITK